MGTRKNSPNKRTLELLPEQLLRYMYQELDMADREIAIQVGLKRDTVKKMRDLYGIPNSPKLKNILAWHKNRSRGDVESAAEKNWKNRRANGTDKTGFVPQSAFRPGNDNGKTGKTHNEIYGPERAREINERISSKLKGRSAGENNPMFGKPPMNRMNSYRGGYVDSPLQGKVWVRSSWEIEYANHLTSCGIQWLYEPTCFDLGNGRTYWPDFYLPDTDEWHEVKGYITDLDKMKFSRMESVHSIFIKIISWDEMKALNLRTRPINSHKRKKVNI